jgi:MFS family permease
MSAIITRVTTISLLRSLGHGSFALLWCGQTLSRIGDFLYEIALAWWVLQETGSAAAMAGLLIFVFTPMVLFLLIGGVAVDRFPRVRLMLASDISRGVVMMVVAVLAFSNSLQLWQVYMASLVFGFLDAFFQPAYAAVVPQITPAENLPSANSLTSLSLQIGRVLGPALGAAIVSLGGTSTAFALNGLTFFISAAFLAPLAGLPTPPREGSESTSVIRDALEGIAIVLRTPWLWISIAVFALSNLTLARPYSVEMPFLVKDTCT